MKRFILGLSFLICIGLFTTSCGEEGGEELTLTETFNEERNGVLLIMNFVDSTDMFVGTVENMVSTVKSDVRVEVHLSNGVELGPTTPQDLAVGEKRDVTLDATGEVFVGWTPHAEVD